MTHEFNNMRVAELRAQRVRELRALEERLRAQDQERLREVFQTLDEVKRSVAAGDRRKMLELLGITVAALRAFDVLPNEARESLATCLETMRNELEEGFVPRGRGERPERWKRRHEKAEFFTALAVELARRDDGLKLHGSRTAMGAIDKVAERFGVTPDLVHKRWKRRHREAKRSLSLKFSRVFEPFPPSGS